MTIVLKHLTDEEGRLVFQKPSAGYAEKLNKLLSICDDKANGYVLLTLDRPYKKRTTGDLSQNNLIWKLITLIANETGDDSEGMRDTENAVKLRSLARGYPFHVNKLTGKPEPESMTKINTVQAGYLIETAYQICAEHGIVIPPNYREEA